MKRIELENYAGRENIRLDELLDSANSFMDAVAPVQPNDRVTETLSERTLRYYISQGLVDRPSGKEGAAALYGYRHLLQLLAIKRLQASYLPVRKIREILPNSSDKELKAIILGGAQVGAITASSLSTRDSAIAFLESIAQGEPTTLSFQESRSPQSISTASIRSSPRSSGSDTATSVPEPWERFVLDDGIELHIRSDRKGSLRKSEIRRLFDRFLKLF